MAESKKQIKVIIIGAGIGGISTAINLKRKLGFTNFTIYEKASEVGGTWRDNTYPGCACDVPIHWYSLSSELKPDWSKYFAEQSEILAYWRALAAKHHLYSNIVFDSRVASLTWEQAAQAWKVEVERNASNGELKKREIVMAELVVSAAGGFVVPAYSNLEGRDMFQGPMFHSARWDYGVNLNGKRVGVIGNGCSAAQFIPKISEDPSVQVTNFCRTANWFVPKHQFQYSAVAKWVFRYVPLTARIYRIFIAAISDLAFIIWRQKNKRARSLAERQMMRYMRKTAPKKYHQKLTPDYPVGCKRIIVDPDYYASLHRPNVELEWGGVKEIVKDGLITQDGKKHELDVIIYGTGFLLVNPELRIVGREGRSLHEYFEWRGGPEAYVGTTIPGLPNMFFILGPNVASGHASAIFSEEQQIEYALQLMRPVIAGKARSFEVRQDASNAFNDDLQRRIGETTWVSCQSYYRAGTGNTGKVFATFPDYTAVGAEKWERERKFRNPTAYVVWTILLTFAWATLWKTGVIGAVYVPIMRCLDV